MKNTDEETLGAARAWLVSRGTELRERVQRVNSDLRREHEPLPADFSEAAVAVENDEVLEAIQSAAQAELRRVEWALARIEAGTFLKCEVCGKPIERARLKAVPYASRCSGCEPAG